MIQSNRNWQAALLAVLLLTSSASAQTSTWTSVVSGNWSIPTNWDTLPASGATQGLVFGASGAVSYTATNDLANPFLLNSMTFNNTGTGTISVAPAGGGGALTFSGAGPQIINNGTGPVSISNPVNLGANTVFGGPGTGTVTLSGGINDGGGGFGLNTGGAGTYSLSGGPSSLSFIRVDAGTTNVTGGAWTVTAATDNNLASLVVGTTAAQTGTFNLSGGATLTSSAGNLIFGDPAGSTGNGLITGAGTTVTATNATLGRLSVGNSGTGSVTISGGASVTNRITNVGRNASSNGTVIVDGAGTLWATTTGGFNVAGANLSTGVVTIRNGAAATAGSQILVGNGTGNGTINIQTGGTFTVPAAVATNMFIGVSTGATGTINVSGAGSRFDNLSTGANIFGGGATPGGVGNLSVTAGGVFNANGVTFAQNSGSSSTATIDAATLSVRGQLAVGLGTAGNITPAVGNLTIQNGGTATVGGSAFAGGNPGAVGTVTVTGANSTLTSTTTGTFMIYGGGATPGGTGNLNVLAGGNVTGFNVTFAQNTSTASTSVVDAATLQVNTQFIVGSSGNGALTVQNGGVITSTASSFVAAAVGSVGNLTITGTNSALTQTGTGQFQVGGSGGADGGAGSVTVSNGGSLTTADRLTIYAPGSVTATNATTFSVGALSNGSGTTAGPLALNGTTATITNGLALAYNGVISGNGSVVKQGTGVQTLGGASTYTGTTTVNGGSLFINGSLSAGGGQVTVNTGGTIGGTGTINRDVLANTGGVIKPGASPGILTVGGNVTMSAGAIHGFEYTAPVVTAAYDSGGSAVPGTAPATGVHNQLIVNGNYTVNPGAILRVAGSAADFTANLPYSFQVATVSGTINGGAGFNITNPAQFDFSSIAGFQGATNLQWHNVGGAVFFNFTPVPEPLHILAVAGLGAAGFRWVRKRRKAQVV